MYVNLSRFQIYALIETVERWRGSIDDVVEVDNGKTSKKVHCDGLIDALSADHLDVESTDRAIEFTSEFNTLCGADPSGNFETE